MMNLSSSTYHGVQGAPWPPWSVWPALEYRPPRAEPSPNAPEFVALPVLQSPNSRYSRRSAQVLTTHSNALSD